VPQPFNLVALHALPDILLPSHFVPNEKFCLHLLYLMYFTLSDVVFRCSDKFLLCSNFPFLLNKFTTVRGNEPGIRVKKNI